MRLILYGSKADKAAFTEMLAAFPELCYRHIRIEDYSNRDSFLKGLSGSPPDSVVVAMNGADGMEGVIAAKTAFRDIPVVWFSDDGGFGAQSYRLGCAYFHKKPLSREILSAALDKCLNHSICKGEIR